MKNLSTRASITRRGARTRALGQPKEARQLSAVRNPGGLLTKIFKDIASEAGIALH